MQQLFASRVKGKPRKITSFRLSEQTIEALDKIRALFHAQYPEAAYPTCSLVLEKAIVSQLTRLQRPEVLAVELVDFERRYGAKLKASMPPAKKSQIQLRREMLEAGRGSQVKNTPPR